MKYTFLLPAFKGRFLDEMLRSIQGQTYTDFKVIISNDCSPEDLYSICKPYLSDPRFTYRRNEENMGSKSLVSHWNLLVDMCDTEFLILASDDDVYEPQFLEEIDQLTVKYPEVDLFRARVNVIDSDGDITEKDFFLEENLTQLDFLYFYFHKSILKCISNYAFRTSSLKTKGGFYDLPLAWGSDDVTVSILSENGVCNTPSFCFSFRISGLNITSSGSKDTIREKTTARYLLLQFYEDYLQRLKKSIQTKLEMARFQKLESYFYHGFHIKNLYEGAEYSSLKEMKAYYKYLSRREVLNGKLDKVHFLWTWIRAYKIRSR